MPITLTVPEGLLSQQAQAQAFAGLTDAVLDAAGLTGNDFMTANIIGTINVLPQEHVLAAGEPIAAAFVELKLPEIALVSAEAKQAFFGKSGRCHRTGRRRPAQARTYMVEHRLRA
ncbi:hypothetical protein ACVIEM_006343 [Rhizobium leguminosarum]